MNNFDCTFYDVNDFSKHLNKFRKNKEETLLTVRFLSNKDLDAILTTVCYGEFYIVTGVADNGDLLRFGYSLALIEKNKDYISYSERLKENNHANR